MVAKRADEFDVIHNHHDYWMLPLSEMTSTPIVSTLHGRVDYLDAAAAFLSYPKSYFVSISNSQRNALPQARWLQTIYHGINVNDFTYYEKPGKYLAFLGRISRDKRPDWAIEIAYKSGVPLKIAAKIGDSESQDYFDHFVKPHVDGKFIEYVGEISENEKSSFLGNALALLFPIDWPEPFGLVLIESLACGTPVLARPCGAIPELLQNGVTGFLSPDIYVLANHILDDIQKIDRRVCREWVQNRFSLQRMTEDYVNVYRHITKTRSESHRHRWDLIHPI
jgi:glycosyltransferase involved in cell wall biosynthesis